MSIIELVNKSLVDQILTTKKEDPEANTNELEEYELYGLSEEEIGIVEETYSKNK